MIKPIKHFCLNEHANNLYKKEAGSSFALTKDVADKINEIVDEFNKLAKDKWEKIHEQDGTIRKAVLYMKDNLINSLYDLLMLYKGNGMLSNLITSTMLENDDYLLKVVDSMISIKNYGADPTGTYDCTNAIQKALNDTKIVLIPRGTYLVNKTINVPAGAIVIGSGRESIIKMTKAQNDDTNAIFTLKGDHIRMENLYIDGSDLVNGIAFKEHTYHFTLSNLLITNTLKGLYDYESLWMGSFENVHIRNSEVGFSFARNNDKTSLNLKNCWCENCGTPYHFYRVNYSTLSGCGADWCNYIQNNPYTKGYGSEETNKGVYHFELCKGLTMNGCGSENCYGNGLIYLSATSLVVNGLVATNIKSRWLPYVDENPKVRVGDIFLASEKNKLVLNGYCFNSRFENLKVKELYPDHVQPIIAYNYDEKVYGKQENKSVIVSALQDGGNVVFEGCGNYQRDCTNLDHDLTNIKTETLEVSGYKHFGAKKLEGDSCTKIVIPMVQNSYNDFAHKLKISGIDGSLTNRPNGFYVEVAFCSSTFIKQITILNSSNGITCEGNENNLVINLPSTYNNIQIECSAISDKLDLIDWNGVALI